MKEDYLIKGGVSSEVIKNVETLYLLKVSQEVSDELNKGIEIAQLTNSLINSIHNDGQCRLVIGNDIPQCDVEKYALVEFEDYIYERYIGKRIVIIYGNCHTTVISEILDQCPEFNEIFRIYPIDPIHTITDLSYFDKPIFKWCDVFIHQSIQRENRYGIEFSSENIITYLHPNCQIIAIPNVYQMPVCFFPQYKKMPEYVRRDGGAIFFRDSILDMAAEMGLSYKNTVIEYWYGKHFEDEELGGSLRSFFDKIERREKDWDIKCLDYIKSHYKTERLFYDPNHPTNIFIFYVAMRLLDHMGIRTEKDSLDDYDLTLLSGYEMPILPEVKQYFGMTFSDLPEMRRGSINKVLIGSMNGYKDYIRQYLACQWQNGNVKKIYAIKWHGVYYLMKLYNKIWRFFNHGI